MSETERKYLAGEFQPKEDAYERKLHSNIAKKALKFIEAMPDFALILKSERLPERLKDKLLSWNNYQLKILPFAQALYLSLFFKVEKMEDEVQALQDSLEEAGIPYQPKRLRMDQEYRLTKSMIYAKWLYEHQPAWLHEYKLASLGIDTEVQSVKRTYVGLLIDEKVWKKFKETAKKKSISLKRGINEALKGWISRI
ncbi:MAG: hypothetical protein QXY07_03200 [Candidatus Bathyarchaeia archaeon]